MKTIARNLTIAAFTLAAMATTACNTIEGVGKDAKSAGKKVEEVAKDAKN